MLRLRSVTLLAVVAVLVAVNAFVFFQTQAGPATAAGDPPGQWQRWQAMSIAERRELLGQYHAIAQRDDAAVIWRRAHEFGRLPPERQERLRALMHLTEETVSRQPSERRREFIRSSDAVRAFLIYQALRSDDPDTLRELRRRRDSEP